MLHKKMKCSNCGSQIEVNSFRKFVLCAYCGTRIPFAGFEYEFIQPQNSMYANVKYWMDCPACRSPQMYLGTAGRIWKCPDCGYKISNHEKNSTVFWFCDECETYLNIQRGFTVKNGKWKCTECGCLNDVTRGNII